MQHHSFFRNEKFVHSRTIVSTASELSSGNSVRDSFVIYVRLSVIGQPVRKSANQPFDQLITEERVIKLATYCSMSQYFMSPSFPELTIKPASFFPFTIINLSLTHSTLEKRQTRTINNRILLLKIQSIIIVIYHLCHHHYYHHWRYRRTLWSG